MGKTHCKHGHEYTPENTYINPSNGGYFRCRTCHRLAERGKHNRRAYGSDYDRDAHLASQGNVCAICGIAGLTWCESFTKSWHVDHNHDLPGIHRGVLCATCNLALGKLEPHIDKVVAYLAKYAAEQRAPRTEAAI